MRPENGTHRMHFHGALSGLVREDEFHGRDHLVAPVVMVREMVLDQGTHGELLPGEEIERSAELRLWEGRPVTIGHPEEHFSAGELKASEEAEVGRLRNVEAVANGTVKLKGEAWIDIEQAERIPEGEQILNTLRDYTQSDVPDSARPLEVSTGYLAQFEREGGVLGNERYAGIQRAIIPDHLALLPNGVGKCSREDGCGMPRLNAAGEPRGDGTLPEEEVDAERDDEESEENAAPSPGDSTSDGYLRRALSSVADRLDQDEIGRRVLEALGVTGEEEPVEPETNQIELPEDFSLDDLRDALDDAVEAEHGGSDVFTWIVDVFEEDFVFTVDPQGEEETFFRADYTVKDGVVEIGEQTEVERQVEFVPVDNGAGVELEVEYEPVGAEDEDAGPDEDRFQIENGEVRVADGCECGDSEERTPAPAGA